MDLLHGSKGVLLQSAEPMGGGWASEYELGVYASVQWEKRKRQKCCHIHSAHHKEKRAGLCTTNRARWHLITKGKHKEAPGPAAGLSRDSKWVAGWSRGLMRPAETLWPNIYMTIISRCINNTFPNSLRSDVPTTIQNKYLHKPLSL